MAIAYNRAPVYLERCNPGWKTKKKLLKKVGEINSITDINIGCQLYVGTRLPYLEIYIGTEKKIGQINLIGLL